MRPYERAAEAIRQRLKTGHWGEGDCLPPVRELAEWCSVSPSTMRKAMGVLVRESLLHTRQRVGTIAGPKRRARRGEAKHGDRGRLWQRVADRVGRDILTGALPETGLSATSKLALRYGVNARTMKKALQGLVGDGVLLTAGRSFRALPPRSKYHGSHIVLVGTKGTIRSDQRLRDISANFERDAVRLGLSPRFESVDLTSPNGFIDFTTAFEAIDNVRGCLVNIWNPWDPSSRRRWFDLLSFLVRRDLPIVVIDQTGDLALPDPLRRSRAIRVLRLAGEKAGMMVGRSVVRQGHRKVAFVTRTFDEGWVQDRYNGLCTAIRAYGSSAPTVELFVLHEAVDQDTLNLMLLNLDDDSVGTLYSETQTPAEIRDLQRKAREIRGSGMAREMPVDDVTESIRYMARSLVGLAGQNHDRTVYMRLFERLFTVVSEKALELSMRLLFEKVLTEGAASLWVFPDEKTALAAVSFLRSAGRRVPEDIAVFGFDRWRENIEQQLSTYDFNMRGFVSEGLLMILDERRFRNAPAVSEVDGYLIERITTRK